MCVTGLSGCGKTTLLLAVKGLLYQGADSGTITVGVPGASSNGSTAGMVLQNAESQILCTAVSEEVAFGPENLCVPAEEIGDRVETALQAVGLNEYGSRTVEQLSLGQKQRLAIASVLSMQPQLLLLDEPTSQLDGPGKIQLLEVLQQLKSRGHALLITEHDLGPLHQIADWFVTMENGAIKNVTRKSPAHIAPEATPSSGRRSSGIARVLAARDLSLSYAEHRGSAEKSEHHHLPGRARPSVRLQRRREIKLPALRDRVPDTAERGGRDCRHCRPAA